MEGRNFARRALRWAVILVVVAMLLGLIIIPFSTALGEDSGTAPASSGTAPAGAGGTAPATDPANPHAGVPGAPGGPAPSADAPASQLPGQMGVEVTHLVLTGKDKAVGVFQMLQLVNNTAKATGPVIIPLPEGATGLQVMGLTQDQFSQDARGLTLKSGLAPGESQQLTYRYDVPAEGQALSLKLTYPYPVAQVFILTDPTGLSMPPALNTAFADAEGMEINNKVYRQFSRSGLKAGERLQLSLQLAPDEDALAQAAAAQAAQPQSAAGAAPAAKSGGAALPVTIGAVALAAFLGILLWQNQRRRQAGMTGPELAPEMASGRAGMAVQDDGGQLLRRKAELINQIAALDRMRAAGEIEEAEHGQRRGAYKQELIAALRELKRMED